MLHESSFCPKTPPIQTPFVNLTKSMAEILKEVTDSEQLPKLQKHLKLQDFFPKHTHYYDF